MTGGLRALWRRARDGWQRQRIETATSATLRALDDRVLHDLGLDRSQIPSVAAAVAGRLACQASAAVPDVTREGPWHECSA